MCVCVGLCVCVCVCLCMRAWGLTNQHRSCEELWVIGTLPSAVLYEGPQPEQVVLETQSNAISLELKQQIIQRDSHLPQFHAVLQR